MESVRSEKSSAKSESGVMSDVDWRTSLEVIAGSRSWGDTRESMIARAARRAGITFRAAKALYYGETRDPRDSIARAIRHAVAARDLNAAIKMQADRLATIADGLEARDADFHRQQIDHIRHLVSQMRMGVSDVEAR